MADSSMCADDEAMLTAPSVTETAPRLRTKMTFWLLIGMTSMAMAEVLSGSYPLPFVAPAGWLLVLPVYLVHSVLGIWIVQRFGRVNTATLYLAGMLFGFYEFYLTKVLWGAPWGSPLLVGGIDVVSLVILAAWWHPLFAFMFPLAISETAATSSRTIAPTLPFGLGHPAKRTAVTLLIVVAVVQGTVAPDPAIAAVSTITTWGGLAVAFLWWRRSEERTRWSLGDLLPKGRQVAALIAATAAVYIFYFFAFNPDAVPSLGPQVLTWLLYAAVIGLLMGALQRSRKHQSPSWIGPPDWWPPLWLPVASIYTTVVIAGAASGAFGLGFALIWIPGFVIGGILTWRAVRYALGFG